MVHVLSNVNKISITMFQSYWADEYIGEKLFCSVLWKFSVELMEDFP